MEKFEDVMQNIREVLRVKEQQLEQLQKEIDALRVSIRILEEEEKGPPKIGAQRVEPAAGKENGSKPNGGLKHFP